MTILLHELRRNRISLCIWSCVIAFMLCISIMIYPEMGSQMDDMGDMFSQMGDFTAAFGMDKVNFGEFSGYFAIECGNVLGLGGAIFAAILGISALSKEEKEHTAEFLLTHPVSRKRIVGEKLASVFVQIIILNVFVFLFAFLSMLIIGEKIKFATFVLLFVGYLAMQIEICAITFGISAFSLPGGFGIGLGVSMVFYFMNILSNLSEDIVFLKYITPFAYADGAYIVSKEAITLKYLLVGVLFTVIGICAAFAKYTKKDIS